MKQKRRNAIPNGRNTESFTDWGTRYLAVRGINRDVAERNRVKVTNNGDIIFTKIDPLTGAELDSTSTRWREPHHGKDGKLMRFTQRKGSGNDPYYACVIPWDNIFVNTKISVVMSEGPTRSLAASSLDIPCIGCVGVDGMFKAGTHRKELHPSIARIKLKGRRVHLAFDVDAESNARVKDAVQAAARLLTSLGAKVYIICIPRVTPDGKTGLDDLLSMPHGAEIFKALCDAAPLWNASADSGNIPSIERLSDVEAKTVEYLWQYRLPLGMICGLEGNPGECKTFVSLHIAAEGSRGYEPFSKARCKPYNTLYMSNENITAVTTKQRFKAMGGDERRFYVLNGAVSSDGKERGVTLADVPVIETAIVKTAARLLIIDPLQSYMGTNVDSHKANETRPLLDGLAKLAERLNICILIIRHLAKGSGGRAIHRGLGSIDITGAMRSVLMAGTAPDDRNNRALVHTKSNIGPLAESLRFTIEGKDSAARLLWKGKSSLTTADLAAPEAARSKSQIDLAVEYLCERLHSGPKPIRELINDEFSERTLQRASHRIGVIRKGGGAAGPVIWSMPKFTNAVKEGKEDA